jgi:hypothetical protein
VPTPKDEAGAIEQPLLDERMAEVVLAAIGQDIVAIPASVRNDVIMVVVRMGDAIGLRAIAKEGYAAVIRPADGAVLEANEQPDNIPASLEAALRSRSIRFDSSRKRIRRAAKAGRHRRNRRRIVPCGL